MVTQLQKPLAILRRKQVQARTGLGKSTQYTQIAEGLFPKPISLGERAVGWPNYEVDAVNAARIAGKSDDEIRALVIRLEAERKNLAAANIIPQAVDLQALLTGGAA